MRILQLSGDWKWTGPAEPMLQLALALRDRGCHVQLACPPPPDASRRSLAGEARAAGLPLDLTLAVGRGVRLLSDRADVDRLRSFLVEHAIDVVHTWHTRDHVLALRAVGAPRRALETRVVRSYREARTLAAWPWNRFLFGPGCDGLICVSPNTASANRRLRGGRPVVGVQGAVDVDRFVPGSPEVRVREELGLKPEHRVVGIVARVQPHRRFDLLLSSAAQLFAKVPTARLLVVGRGTRRRELAEEPARRLGIGDRVVFAGYRNADYLEVLRSIDVFTFLVPGSDGTCRALLEAAACGIPAVASRRGALPELVVDGSTGLLVEEDPRALADAWERLLTHDEERARLGRAARARATELHSPARVADRVQAFYRTLAGRR